MQRRGHRVRTALGALTLAYGIFSVVSLPFDIRSGMFQDVISAEGRLAWLVGLSMPWRVLAYCSDVIQVVGLFAAAIGLLLARARPLHIGLVALVPSLVVQLLFVPGAIALLSGQASIRLIGSPPARVIREAALTLGLAWLAMAAVLSLYVLWLWRELRRLTAEG
jgi:hypothetical protein